MPFLQFTVVIEYGGRMTAGQRETLAHEIEQSVVRHVDTVAAGRQFDKLPKAKYRVLPVHELPEMRDQHGWHTHDNDGACTPCVRLYEYVYNEQL